MNSKLRTLQLAVSQALAEENVTAEQIVEVFRETIKNQRDEARAKSSKATAALDLLKIPHQYTSTPEYLTFAGLAGSDTISFGQDTISFGAAQPVNDGLPGGLAEDVLAL